MKANVPKEHEDAAYNFTYNKLMVEVLNKKVAKAESEGKDGYKNWLEGKLRIVLAEQAELRKFLREHRIKVTDIEEVDDMFVLYKVYYGSEAGGYKEGHQKIWRSAMKFRLTKLLNELLS